MSWELIAYASIFCGFCAIASSGYTLQRICVRLSGCHPAVFDRLGRPTIRKPGRWPSKALRGFLRSREDRGLDDSVLSALCTRFHLSVRVGAAFAAVAFVAVFASAFARAA